ncbi:hypothetical protein K1719_008845 [Acacia pycnantha]|nr:hypothetical protein K1719_008845 [Acacia pycnantha]
MLPIHGCEDEHPNANKTVYFGKKQFPVKSIIGHFPNLAVIVRDADLQKRLEKDNCDALCCNITLPITLPTSSPLGFFFILPNILTMYKCDSSLNYTVSKQFLKYTGCAKSNHETIFFRSQDQDHPPPSLATCSRVQLPVNMRAFSSDPFTFIASDFTFNIKLSDDCFRCSDNNKGICRLNSTGGFYCSKFTGKLQDGREVAVKHLFNHNYKRVEQFMTEVEILTRLRHKNLVSLYGCTSRQSRELLLVYEYIPNGTLVSHLRGGSANPSLLTWPLRIKIAIETASALSYLHASGIIHRDVKTNNILLDNNFCVKVADFGLSRLFPDNVSHVSTAPPGTPGYLDPEYYFCFRLTNKSDVYSFGVVLMELISSMPAVDMGRNKDEITLGALAVRKIQRNKFEELVDPCLRIEKDSEVKKKVVALGELAFRCLQIEKEMRPH